MLSKSEVIEIEEQYQLRTYRKYPLVIERGQGVYVYDSEGSRYLDFYAGHAVCLVGHCHPKLVEAIKAQAEKLIFYSNLVYTPIRAEASRALVKFAPPEFSQVFLCNSGAEANETALKISRRFTGKSHIIAMEKGFHGRTFGALSATGYEKYRIFPPHLPAVDFVPFADLQQLEKKFTELNGDVACVILEPVQSMAGVRLAAPEYYRGLRELCSKFGALLIFDEIQTGFGRCGANFFCERVGITPDLISCAKGIAGGVPMGAVLCTDKVAKAVKLGEQGTTFGGSPLSCAASFATLQILEAEKLVERAAELGGYLMQKLSEAGLSGVKEIRGAGLLVGIEFEREAAPLISALLDRKIIIGSSEDPCTLRLIPPLTISKENCDEVVSALKDCANKLFN